MCLWHWYFTSDADVYTHACGQGELDALVDVYRLHLSVKNYIEYRKVYTDGVLSSAWYRLLLGIPTFTFTEVSLTLDQERRVYTKKSL